MTASDKRGRYQESLPFSRRDEGGRPAAGGHIRPQLISEVQETMQGMLSPARLARAYHQRCLARGSE